MYHFENFWWVITPLVIVDVILKGMALWKSAQRKQTVWFIALLIINSVGILPLIYLLFFSKKK
jgi:hypothetical protein